MRFERNGNPDAARGVRIGYA